MDMFNKVAISWLLFPSKRLSVKTRLHSEGKASTAASTRSSSSLLRSSEKRRFCVGMLVKTHLTSLIRHRRHGTLRLVVARLEIVETTVSHAL